MMPKRLPALATLVVAVGLLLLAVLPIASASAAEPWWQVLTGSRPTKMWEPADATETQEVTGKRYKGLIFAAKVEVGGKVIACLGSGTLASLSGPPATKVCEKETGLSAINTAAQLKKVLEGVYGAGEVQVTGGPAGTAPFQIESPWGPPVEVSAIDYEGFGALGEDVGSTVLSEASGRLVLILTNLGDAPVDGTGTPVTITDQLPEGAIAVGVEALAGGFDNYGPVGCVIKATDQVACTYEGEMPPYEAIEVEVLTVLEGSPPVAGAPGKVTVSGGNAAADAAEQSIEVSDEPVPFGIEKFSSLAEEEGGGEVTRAGSHPFQFTNTLQLNAGAVHPVPHSINVRARNMATDPPGMPRNLRFPLPAGLVGNAAAVPQCEMTSFLPRGLATNTCPDATVIGVTSVTVVESANLGFIRLAVPVFNLSPVFGEPARFGFVAAGVPVLINTEVDPADDYRIAARVSNISQVAQFLSATTTFWGTPGDPRHDNSRGWGCVYFLPSGPCERPPSLGESAFLRMPVQCAAPLEFGLSLERWNVPLGSEVASASDSGDPLLGCNSVPFDPTVESAPTTKLAQNPSGLDFKLTMPNFGLSNKDGIAEGQAKKVEVTLPEGMTINPSQAEGLATCSPAQFAAEKVNSSSGAGCPEASKLAEVKVSTPLLKEEARGAVYVATPYDNPFDSLVSLYMVARIPERGILVKQAGKVDLDPSTGRITTTFDQLPQLPYSSFSFRFRPGARAPLVTPPACGNYDILARFTPWSAQDPESPSPEEIVSRSSTFTVERGVDGGACPAGGASPFHPDLLAGTTNNAAGSFSPFNVRITRKDGEQELTNFSIKLPPGVAGKLAGVATCSDAAIARAISRTGPHGGQEELDDPSCPATSQVGRTLAGAGVGQVLAYAPGKIYLAGPYHGRPVSLVSITAGVVGPFDIGTVVVRLAIDVNPETGEVFLDSTGSDPIPHIVKGAVLHLRDVRAYTDRPNFTYNPTSCKPTSTAATVLGSGLDVVSPADDNPLTVTSPFQAADCAALPFAPKLSLQLIGGTKRGAHPALKAFLRMNGFGEAGIAKARVTLPRSEFIANAHFNTICTRVQFKAAGGNGEACPAGSIYGWARAKSPILADPLEGPVFLRSSEHELPDVVASLRGQQIDVHLVGHVDSVKGQLRTTFETVPDAPVEWASFSFKGAKKGLFENSTNLCKDTHKAKVELTGQNGKEANYGSALKVKCSAKGKKKAKQKRTAR